MIALKTKFLKYIDSVTNEEHLYEVIPPAPTETDRGGIIASPKTDGYNVEAKLGNDGKLYVPTVDLTDYYDKSEIDENFALKSELNNLSSYETKEDAQAKLEQAKTYTDTVASGKANKEHTHDIDDVSGLQTALNAKASTANATTASAGLMSAADKIKLNGIEENANNYSHPTTSGNKHIPSGGSSGQFLKWKSDGTAEWAADNDTKYAAGAGIALNGTTFSNSGVRSVETGTTNGTIIVNTNGTTASVPVKGLGAAAYVGIDSALSDSSTNAIQTKVVNSAISTLTSAVLANTNSITALTNSVGAIEEITSAEIASLFA